MNSFKARRLIGALAQSSDLSSGSQKTKENLFRHVGKVRDLSGKNEDGTPTIETELKLLEEKVSRILELGENLAEREKKDVSKLEEELYALRAKLSLPKPNEIRKKLDRILFLLSDIAARVESYTELKSRHSRRSVEIEDRLRRSSTPLSSEIRELEDKISGLEKSYEKLSQASPKRNEKVIAEIRKRTEALRQQVASRKAYLLEQQAASLAQRPVKLPRIVLPVEEIPPAPQKVKHRMLFNVDSGIGSMENKQVTMETPAYDEELAKKTSIHSNAVSSIPVDAVPLPPSKQQDMMIDNELAKIEAEIQSELPFPPVKKKQGFFKHMFGKKRGA